VRLELTELLACPRCGPDRGFVAFVDRLEDGVIVEGRIDCPECEDRHPLRGGVLYMATTDSPGGNDDPDPAAAELAGALLGVPSGPEVLLAGPGLDSVAATLAADRPGASILLLTRGAATAGAHVHPIALDDAGALPFRSGRIQGAVLRGGAESDPSALARVLAPGSRVVILEPDEGLARYEAGGLFDALATDSRAAVLVASPPPAI
jgi:uncharacterized protein YbaR (Trm112 family)